MQSHNNLFLVNYIYYGWYQLISVIQNTYYHLNTTHILRKKNEFNNKMSITDRLMISLSCFQVEVINMSGLVISAQTRNQICIVNETPMHLIFHNYFFLSCFSDIALVGISFVLYLMIPVLQIGDFSWYFAIEA